MTTVDSPSAIRWPPGFEPASCPVHVRNELVMAAPPATAWAWLVRAERWPSWYENSRDVRFLDGPPPDLRAGTRFRWRTFGVAIESRVLEFEPPERLAWDAHAVGVHAYHAWLLRPVAGGCHVVTEETQHGLVARLGALVMPGRMYRFHQIWLEGLARQSAAGPPS